MRVVRALLCNRRWAGNCVCPSGKREWILPPRSKYFPDRLPRKERDVFAWRISRPYVPDKDNRYRWQILRSTRGRCLREAGYSINSPTIDGIFHAPKEKQAHCLAQKPVPLKAPE